MPVPPAELTAELTIAPGDDRAVQAGREAAAATGLALDTGPTTTALSAGATSVELKLEVPHDAREHS